MRPVRLAPRPEATRPDAAELDLDLTQPVLRLSRIPRPRVPRQDATAVG
jgi:hypothetical protein